MKKKENTHTQGLEAVSEEKLIRTVKCLDANVLGTSLGPTRN